MTDLPPGVTGGDGPPLDAWRAWTPTEVARRLAGVDVPWCVVGGWSIDLFLGEQTRPHANLEIAVPRADLPPLRKALDGVVHHAVGDGRVRALAAGEPPPDDTHQNWLLDVAADVWRVPGLAGGRAGTHPARPCVARAPRHGAGLSRGSGMPEGLSGGTGDPAPVSTAGRATRPVPCQRRRTATSWRACNRLAPPLRAP
jgi:hypothetical protein